MIDRLKMTRGSGKSPATSGSNSMFRQYDPFLTFHNDVTGHFVSPDGKPLDISSADINALYRVAHIFYDKLRDRITSRNNFESIQAEYLQGIGSYRRWFTEPYTVHFPDWVREDIETIDWKPRCMDNSLDGTLTR